MCINKVFTVVVGKKNGEEEFSPKDLELFHEECNGGSVFIEVNVKNGWWHLSCERCKDSPDVLISNYGTTLLTRTAMDGEEREINALGQITVYAISKQ